MMRDTLLKLPINDLGGVLQKSLKIFLWQAESKNPRESGRGFLFISQLSFPDFP